MERANHLDDQMIKEAMQAVGLESLENRAFPSLSCGEQQRVILAQASVQQTPVLILDEPTNHLDSNYQLQVRNAESAS